jgi:hypothetical protein
MNTHFIGFLQALDKINENLDGYQEEYKQYIIDHKRRVKQFAEWMKENLPELFTDIDYNVDIDDFDELIAEHDQSKFSEEEFEAYAEHFYGSKENDFEFEQAWEHHWQNNEHHPEYWGGEDMPYIYILEMLCDWGSFGIAKGDITELVDYYYSKAKDDEDKNLSDNTKLIIEEILSKIKEAANE